MVQALEQRMKEWMRENDKFRANIAQLIYLFCFAFALILWSFGCCAVVGDAQNNKFIQIL